MTDVFTKAKRSVVMSQIRGRGNKVTEVALLRIFREHGIRGWRRHVSLSLKVPGPKLKDRRGSELNRRVRPDFVFPKLKLAVFVDGCFWHGCPRHGTQPKSNAEFWRKKLAANKARDWEVTRSLRKRGWRVVRIWEHDLKRNGQAKLLKRLEKAIAES